MPVIHLDYLQFSDFYANATSHISKSNYRSKRSPLRPDNRMKSWHRRGDMLPSFRVNSKILIRSSFSHTAGSLCSSLWPASFANFTFSRAASTTLPHPNSPPTPRLRRFFFLGHNSSCVWQNSRKCQRHGSRSVCKHRRSVSIFFGASRPSSVSVPSFFVRITVPIYPSSFLTHAVSRRVRLLIVHLSVSVAPKNPRRSESPFTSEYLPKLTPSLYQTC